MHFKHEESHTVHQDIPGKEDSKQTYHAPVSEEGFLVLGTEEGVLFVLVVALFVELEFGASLSFLDG